MKLLEDQRGSVTLIAALGMVVIMGFMALAVDVGQLRYQKRNLQRVADAAALAGMLELNYCGGVLNCAAMQTAARSAAVENGMTPDTVVINCASAPTAGTVLMINDPPCAQGAADPDKGKPTYVEVVLSQPQSTLFARFLGFSSLPLSVRAEASTNGSNCIYSLDPTGSGALTVALLAAVVSPCGIMVESTSTTAVVCLTGSISAPKIQIAGGAVGLLCLAPTPSTYVSLPTPSDPLAYLPQQVVPPCGTTTTSPFHGSPSALTISGTAVLYPDGAYCGGINIQPGATAAFQPGTFSLTSTNGGFPRYPGGLTINLGTNVTGTGVTFYNYGPAGGVTFVAPALTMAGVRLSAPTNGTYGGILFFQPTNNTSPATLLGNTAFNTVLEGAYYFPKATVTSTLNIVANYNILVAYDVVFAAATLGVTNVTTSTFSNNYGTLANGSPVGGTGAVVMQ